MNLKKINHLNIILLLIITVIVTSYIASFNNNSSNFFFGLININEINGNVLGFLSITFTMIIGLLFFLLQNKTNAKIQKSIDTSNNISTEINKIVKKADQVLNEIHSYESKRELLEFEKESVIIKRFLDVQEKLLLHYENFKKGIVNFSQNNFNQSRFNSRGNMTNFLNEYSYLFEITMSIPIILSERYHLLENLGLNQTPSFVTEIEDNFSSFLGGLNFLQMQLDNISSSPLDLQKIRWTIFMIDKYKKDFDVSVSKLEQKLEETNNRPNILKGNEIQITAT